MTKTTIVGLMVVALFSAEQLTAGTVTFDFATGNDSGNSQNGGNGNWAPFANETTPGSTQASLNLNGLTMTLLGTISTDTNGIADEYWGANPQGLGVITDDSTNGLGNAADRRTDSSIGEAINFSFDNDVELVSARFGSHQSASANATPPNTQEEVTITPNGGSAITLFGMSDKTFDYPLGNVAVSAGTVITFTASLPVTFGALFNEITVSSDAIVPEPSSLALACGSTLFLSFLRRRNQQFETACNT